MAEKSKKSEKKLSGKKKMKAGENKFKRIIPALPKDLLEKMNSEKNPETVMTKALENYYGGQNRRYENALQKEIDNNIIEIQRRHISDLKEQLQASNKNYEELMKTYQAYMLQVQPMVEAAQLQKAPDLELQSGNEPNLKEEKPEAKSKKWYEFWK
ncbi:MAG: hypothetical protein LBU81_02505 [Methanosarcinales archaeon]|jgi:hypothetical protein|nr:hypothetical protein [Methanosarcinales archaeon]